MDAVPKSLWLRIVEPVGQNEKLTIRVYYVLINEFANRITFVSTLGAEHGFDQTTGVTEEP
jgi:hypothetical protein